MKFRDAGWQFERGRLIVPDLPDPAKAMTLYFEKTFLFDHLPKTGGTAWRTVLEEMFGRENVTPHLEGRSEIWAVQRFSGFRVISGHFLSLLPNDSRNAARVRVTLLRDPIDRAVSEYSYWRHHAHVGVADRLGQWAQQFDICDFYKARTESNETAATNFCTRHFASRISRDLMHEEMLLSLAIRSLESYGLVGIYEYLHDSVDMFCWKFGLPAVKGVPRVNVTASRIRVTDLDRQTVRRLTEMNHLDVKLYEHALAIFEAQKRRMFRELVRKTSRIRRIRFGTRAPAAGLNLRRRLRTIVSPFVSEASGARRADLAHPIDTRTGVLSRKEESFGSRNVEIVAAQVIGAESATNEVAPGEQVTLCVSITAHENVADLTVGIEISDSFGEVVFGTNTFQQNALKTVRRGCNYDVTFRFAANLNRGRFTVGAALHTGANHTGGCFHWRDNVTKFDVVQLGEPDFIGYCRLEPTIEWFEVGAGSRDSMEPGQSEAATA